MARIKTLSMGDSSLSTNMNTLDFVVGTPTEFEFTTVAGSKAGTMVKGHSEFDNQDALEKLEYYEVQDGTWKEFPGGDYGPAEGFPLADATSKFRATFSKAGTYTFTAYVSSVDGDERIAECEATATVRATDSALTTNISELDFVVGTPTEFQFTSVAGSNEGLMVKGVSESVNPEVFTNLQYYDEIESTWKEVPSDEFGSDIGLPLYDATLKFRITFTKSGSYPFKVYMKAFNNDAVLATCEATATARATDSSLNTNISELDFVVGTPTEFEFSTVPGSNEGLMVKGFSEFSQAEEAIEKLEYYETLDSSWKEFSGNEFGPSMGFPLTNATSRFRVTFKKAGDYTFTASVKSVNNNAVIADCEAKCTARVKDAALTTNINSVDFVLNIPTEFTFTSVAGSNEGLMVKGISESIDTSVFTDLEYYDEFSSEWKAIPSDSFGTEGLPLYNATLKFRMTFIKAGSYPFKIYMKAVNNDVVLATCEATATARATDSSLTTNLDELDFIVGVPTEFQFTTTAGSNKGLMVKGGSEFDNPDAIEKLEYYEVNDGTWKEFSGDFGPSMGFPLADATSRFRVTFKAQGTYTFTAYVKSVNNDAYVSQCEATANVRDYKKVSIESSFGTGELKPEEPYEFTISFTPNDDLSKTFSGKLSFSDESAFLEMKNDGSYSENTGIFETIVLEEETNEFRVTFSTEGSKTMTFVLYDSDEHEYAKIEKKINVSSLVLPTAVVTLTPETIKQDEEVEINIAITPNDFDNKQENFKYIFSVPDAISHIEQYITDEESEFYEKWVEVSPSNLSEGEVRTVKAEDIKFRVTFSAFGEYTFRVMMDEQELSETIISVEEPEEPIEPIDKVDISVIQKPEGSKIDINQDSGEISFTYQEDVSNEFWSKYYLESTTDSSANVYYGLRWAAPEIATSWQVIVNDSDSGIKDIESDRYVDWYFAIAKSDNEEKPEDGTFTVLDYENTGTKYVITVKFFKLHNDKNIEIYNKTMTAYSHLSENVPDVPEESEVSKVTSQAIKGSQTTDIIVSYGKENSWTQEEINAAIKKYKNDFGQFALDNGLIESEEEKSLLNYASHYTLIDAVIKLGLIDMDKKRSDISEVILATKKGLDAVLEKLSSIQ